MLRELSEYAYSLSKNMATLSSRDKPVTYFIEHLEYIAIVLCGDLRDYDLEIAEPLLKILNRYNIAIQSIQKNFN